MAKLARLAPGEERRRHRVRVPHRPVPRPVRRRAGPPGLLLLHAPGNLFVRDLAPGQSILVQPGAWVYSDPSVSFGLHAEYPSSGATRWGSYDYRTIWLRLEGPGRVAVRSIFEKPERYSGVVHSSGMSLRAGEQPNVIRVCPTAEA